MLLNATFEAHKIRVLFDEHGKLWWVASDLCQALEIKNPKRARSRLETWEKGVTIVNTPRGPQHITVVNEQGLYALIFYSSKPVAERFYCWIAKMGLLSFRKADQYILQRSSKGALIDREKAAAHALHLARAERDRWLSWPSRIASDMAKELNVNRYMLQAVLEFHVLQHLLELAQKTMSHLKREGL